MFTFPSTENDAEEDSVSGEEGAVVDVAAVDTSTLTGCYAMSDVEAVPVFATMTFFQTARTKLTTFSYPSNPFT
jgi:hypothetical protein